MEVIRYPNCDAYHFHECHIAKTIVSRKEEMNYNIHLADTFWKPCSYCINDRAKAQIIDVEGKPIGN